MAETIAFANQKGGVSKTTTAGIVATLLASEGKRVLVCDLDSQGNQTQLLTRRSIYDFEGYTVLEAMQDGDARPYIQDTTVENVKMLTADDVLITLARWMYTDPEARGRDQLLLLREALEHVQADFDYILIDTPPNLGEQMQNALMASDAVVIPFEPAEWCYDAVHRFLKFSEKLGKSRNHEIRIAGILRGLTDVRRSDITAYNELVAEDYPDIVFDTIIKRNAAAGRVGTYGLVNGENKELKDALEPFRPFLKELMARL